MSRPARSDEDLIAASWHVLYEWTMMENTAALLHEGDLPDNHRKWGYLESFGIHARALTFFFFPSGNVHPTDILATDFFHGHEAEWQAILGETPAELDRDTITRLNREFAHLSYDRLKPDRPTRWPVRKMEAAVRELITKFRTKVRPELLHWMWTNDKPTRPPVLPAPTVSVLASAIVPGALISPVHSTNSSGARPESLTPFSVNSPSIIPGLVQPPSKPPSDASE